MPTIDPELRHHLRLPIFLFRLLTLVTVAGFLGLVAAPWFVSDSFPSRELIRHVNPLWFSGVAALATFALCIAIWKLGSRRFPNAKQLPISKALIMLLLLCCINGLMFQQASYNVARIIARSSATTDALYTVTVGRWRNPRGCLGSSGVTWFDPTVDDYVYNCPTFPLFHGYGDPATSRRAIVHIMRGPSGIRVLTVHALDSELGQEDLAVLKAKYQLPASQ